MMAFDRLYHSCIEARFKSTYSPASGKSEADRRAPMAGVTLKRDYDLMGPSGRAAVETGLAAAEWYHTEIPRKEMKALMQRSDSAAIRDTAIWLGSMSAFAALGIY